MSYLTMDPCTLADLKKGIISLWVHCDSQVPSEGWSSNWPTEWKDPPLMENLDSATEIAMPGAAFDWTLSGKGLMVFPAHLWPYPLGGDDLGITQNLGGTYDNGMTKYITFGDPDLKFERVKWNKRKLDGPTVWQYLKGGVPQNLVAQYPTEGTSEPNIVPTSCIGSYRGKLRIILQTKKKADYKGYAWAQKRTEQIKVMQPIACCCILEGKPCSVPDGYQPAFAAVKIKPNLGTGYNIWYDDVSQLYAGAHPETFVLDTGVEMSPGWHHILLAFDISGRVHAEGRGPKGDDPLPGPYGQYSGADGEYKLAQPFKYLSTPEGPDGEYSYAQKAAYGAPFEDVGKYGPADGGILTSDCRAWLAVDDKPLTRAKLNHELAWKTCEAVEKGRQVLDGLDKNAILPPNAFLAIGGEIRWRRMATSGTVWERLYRTEAGGWNGPAARIEKTNEPRQLDYCYPQYDFVGGSIPCKGKPFIVPSKKGDVVLADLQIWGDKTLDFNEQKNRRLFVTAGGEPESPSVAEEELGKPAIRLHWAANWKKGLNTGSLGKRKTGPGSGADPKEEERPDGQFKPSGEIKRYLPDPTLPRNGASQIVPGISGGGSQRGGGSLGLPTLA